MRKLIKNITHGIRSGLRKLKHTIENACFKIIYPVCAALDGNSGEGYIDTGVKILICVVLGGLLLTGLYSLFGDTVLPTLTQRIKEMFNYAG